MIASVRKRVGNTKAELTGRITVTAMTAAETASIQHLAACCGPSSRASATKPERSHDGWTRNGSKTSFEAFPGSIAVGAESCTKSFSATCTQR